MGNFPGLIQLLLRLENFECVVFVSREIAGVALNGDADDFPRILRSTGCRRKEQRQSDVPKRARLGLSREL